MPCHAEVQLFSFWRKSVQLMKNCDGREREQEPRAASSSTELSYHTILESLQEWGNMSDRTSPAKGATIAGTALVRAMGMLTADLVKQMKTPFLGQIYTCQCLLDVILFEHDEIFCKNKKDCGCCLSSSVYRQR